MSSMFTWVDFFPATSTIQTRARYFLFVPCTVSARRVSYRVSRARLASVRRSWPRARGTHSRSRMKESHAHGFGHLLLKDPPTISVIPLVETINRVNRA
jgi:hypothetical protein